MLKKVCIFFTLSMCAQYAVSENISRDSVDDLLQECQRQRQENIAPMKAQAIDDCVNMDRKDPEYCERYYRNYGERTHGGTRPGMFWNLPECEKAVAADQYFKMHPAANEYNYE